MVAGRILWVLTGRTAKGNSYHSHCIGQDLSSPEETHHPTNFKLVKIVGKVFFLLALVLPGSNLLGAAGDLDTSFDPNPPLVSSSSVLAMVRQTDGKIVIGGSFYPTVGSMQRNQLARLNVDGTLDNTFNPGGGPAGSSTRREIYALAIQPDGRILVGGDFTSFNGVQSGYLVRLNRDGTVDNTFAVGVGFDDEVFAVALQPDRKILVGGWFTSYNGVSRRRIIRLNPNGSIDTTFNAGVAAGGFSGAGNRPITTIAVLATGKILLGGWWTEFSGVVRRDIVRVNTDGTLDLGFDARIDAGTFSGAVNVITVDGSGKILIGGAFESLGGVARANIARLEPNGALDPSFDAKLWPHNNRRVNSIAVQPNGKILVTGGFRTVPTGTQDFGVARFEPDGTLDTAFNPTPEPVGKLILQPDSKILIAGGFSQIQGVARSRVARLLGDQTGGTTGTTTPIIIRPTHPFTFPSRATVRITLALGLFGGAANLGNDWKWVSWFGRVHTANAPWYYHSEHGWLYSTSSSENDIWFYQAQTGWMWTSRNTYPLFYRNRDSTWLGYMHGTKNPRWFWNYSTNRVEYIN